MTAIDFSSLDNLKKAVEAELGGQGGVGVELKPIHYERAVAKAVDQLNANKPGLRRHAMSYSPDIMRYELPMADLPGFIEVDLVQFIRPDTLGVPVQLENPFLLQSRMLIPNGLGLMGHGDYAHTLQNLKEAEKVFSAAPDWTGDWEVVPDPANPGKKKRIYALYLKVTDQLLFTPYKVSFVYSHHYEPTNNLLNGLPSIPENFHSWVRDYIVASAKIMLGRIRNKYRGVPGSEEGSVFEMDGEELIQEGREEIAELKEHLKKLKRQIPPMLG